MIKKLSLFTLAVLLLFSVVACGPSGPSGTYTYSVDLLGIIGTEVSLRFDGGNVSVHGDDIGLGFTAGTFSMEDSRIYISTPSGLEISGTYDKSADTVTIAGFVFEKQ